MKIKSNLVFNTSLMAQHIQQGKDSDKVVIGGAQPEYMLIPAGATIELNDEEWKKFERAGAPLLKAESLTMVAAPKLSEKEQEEADAKELSDAKVTLAKLSDAASKKAEAEKKKN
jgi:hypothetical protein